MSLKTLHGHKGYGRFVLGRRWMSLGEEAPGIRRERVFSFGTKLPREWGSVAKCSDAVDSPSWTCMLIQSELHQPLDWWPQHKQYKTNEKTVVLKKFSLMIHFTFLQFSFVSPSSLVDACKYVNIYKASVFNIKQYILFLKDDMIRERIIVI